MNPAYVAQMERQLGPAEAGLYFAALKEPYTRGIRLNPRKKAAFLPEGLQEPIPWAESNAYYLSETSNAGADVLHEAGAWYLQEPSAMASVSVLKPRPGEVILDLCAAPGGKSTQIADALKGKGLLVSNEPVPSRARILSRNIERMGISNSLVISAFPEKLSEMWENLFDAVLVDAPCSGEGMFRRHPETRDEWREGSPEGCAGRQKGILREAARIVRPGGRMVYSTCTFNQTENEGVIEDFLDHHPDWRAESFTLCGVGDAPMGMLHLYPHLIRGEGHFVALLRRNPGSEIRSGLSIAARQLSSPAKETLTVWKDFVGEKKLPFPNASLGEILLSAPDLPPLRGIKVLRAGIQLGIRKGQVWIPDHALALAMEGECPFPCVQLTREEARHYQAGDTLAAAESLRGWVLLSYAGLILGFGKASEGRIKNHYPKGLRQPFSLP